MAVVRQVAWDRSKGRPEPIRALNRIREVDNGEPLVDLKDCAPSLVALRPGSLNWARATVADMAEKAARSLPAGVFLGYSEAWRPLLRQRRIWEWMSTQLDEARPGLTHAAKRRILCRLVAPVDQKAPPGHCTGAAIDVFLIDSDGQPLDVVSPFTRFQSTATYSLGLSPTAQHNRDLLVSSMLSAGFSNCRDEYWHYSWGDAGWAVREGLTESCYGLVELDEREWAEKQAAWELSLAERPNPFLS